MRISLRNADGQEIDVGHAVDGEAAVHEAMMLLVRRDKLNVGDILSVANDNVTLQPQACGK
jgi:hypothetical protein